MIDVDVEATSYRTGIIRKNECLMMIFIVEVDKSTIENPI
jgi:hypothetical protein